MKLLEPITIRNMTIKNRVLLPAMGTGFGYRSRRGRAYYKARALGGTGALLTGATALDLLVNDETWNKVGGAAEFCQGLTTLARDVQETGAKIGVQLLHANRFPTGNGPDDHRGVAIAPSPRVENNSSRGVPVGESERELTLPEIQAIIDKFALASLRVKEAGFDFVELHGAHIYLLSQFFSPLYNSRPDKYGGSLANRMRFGLEILRATRDKVRDFPVFYRLPAWEEEAEGIKPEDAVIFARELEKAGADILNVSVGSVAIDRLTPGIGFPAGTYVHLASAVKKAVNIPVVAVGRINTPELAEEILVSGQADMVAIGRQLIADPNWTVKVAEGRAEEIVPCLSCNVCLDSGVWGGRDLRCTVNPYLGKELEQELSPAANPRKVLVVGGGPAGIKAATVAARRGHTVSLWEKERIGGRLIEAGLPGDKDALVRFTKVLIKEMTAAGVQPRVSFEADVTRVNELKPEVVVLATGGKEAFPELSRKGNPHIMSGLEALNDMSRVRGKVIVVGCGMTGGETAISLAAGGHKVTVLEKLPDIGGDIGPSGRLTLWRRLKKAEISVITGADIEVIEETGVRATREGQSEFFPADTVVMATGMVSNNALGAKITEAGYHVMSIGDCVKPRKIVDAIAEGTKVGRDI